MKLRVKLGKESKVLDFSQSNSASLTLREVVQRVKSDFGIGHDDFQLSLNKKDALDGLDQNLSAFDLVSGDLLHVIGENLPMREPEPPPTQASTKRQPLATYSSGLGFGFLGGPSAEGDVNCSSNNDPSSSVSQENTSGSTQEVAMQETQPSTSGDMNEQSQQNGHSSSPSVNRYLNEPLTIRESGSNGVPALLEQLYTSTTCDQSSDALWVAVHALMLEAGFFSQQQDDGLTQMPEDWKRSGYYTCSYCYRVSHQTTNTCSVTGVTLGSTMAIHGTLQLDSGFKTQSLQLKASHYVRELCPEAATAYRALDRLSRQIKDIVCLPIINEMMTAAGYRERQGLFALPWEVTLRILLYLNVKSLCRLAQTCHEMKVACADKVVWRNRFVKDFGSPSDISLNRQWNQLYKDRYVEAKEEAERLRVRRQMAYVDPMLLPGHMRPFPAPPYPFPNTGIIGGDNDLYPGISPGLLPNGGRGGNPFLQPGPARPRFGLDPFSANPLQPGRRGGNMTGSPFFRDPFGGGGFI